MHEERPAAGPSRDMGGGPEGHRATSPMAHLNRSETAVDHASLPPSQGGGYAISAREGEERRPAQQGQQAQPARQQNIDETEEEEQSEADLEVWDQWDPDEEEA